MLTPEVSKMAAHQTTILTPQLLLIGCITPRVPARVMSQFYLSFPTMTKLTRLLEHQNATLHEVIQTISAADEFDTLRLRAEQKRELNEVAQKTGRFAQKKKRVKSTAVSLQPRAMLPVSWWFTISGQSVSVDNGGIWQVKLSAVGPPRFVVE